ncbi:[FeFe] hydrogenase, group A, partial [Eubacteriales bacterium OttesenSCG-928-N14]|nr:[FeFe] hydrogenase, group A [Eubacteriales bacterium OttesenSCG-928-N14]
MITLTIDGIAVSVPDGSTVLEAAAEAGVKIPTLCYLKDINQIGACRMCLVEIEGAKALQAACVMPAGEGMKVHTNSKVVADARRTVLELLVSDHNVECLSCERNQKCELQTLCEDYGVDQHKYGGKLHPGEPDNVAPAVLRDPSKCVLCRRCVAACGNMQKIYVIDAIDRGFKTQIGAPFHKSLGDVDCINCGQCIIACPVGALYEKDSTEDVWAALRDPNKKVIFQTAPAVRVALGEEFGMPMGSRVTGKMAAAIRRLGAFRTFDTDFAADLTIMEEGTELLQRLENGGKLPMITSCSPGWIKFCEHKYHDFLDNLSTCKSPHEMMGAVLKSYFARKNDIDPKDIFVVSVMPCTAKKFEATRPELSKDGLQDVDAVLTTRELARMIKQANIDFVKLPDEPFDDMLGDSTGAAIIFGATGGVMEAALRTVADILTGQDLQQLDYTDVRGVEGVKEATVTIGDLDVKVAVAHGMAAAQDLLNSIREGKADYHFIEVMGCPGGCVNGGGQPIVSADLRNHVDIRVERA